MGAEGKRCFISSRVRGKCNARSYIVCFYSYFYLLFKVFEFVEQSNPEEKKFYMDILCGRVTKIEKSVLSILVEHPDLDSEFEHRDDSGNSEAFKTWFEKYFTNARG